MTNVDHAIDSQLVQRTVLTDELLIVDKGYRTEPLAEGPEISPLSLLCEPIEGAFR